jgi:hypothetical protein
MRDLEIRKKLVERLRKIYPPGENQIVHELGLCLGVARIDVAVINGKLNGFEIKSEKDTLKRLPEQMLVYNRVFDRLTLVAALKHSEKIAELVPNWWGIYSVRPAKKTDAVVIQEVRPALKNNQVDPKAVVQLLWREEVLDELTKLNAATGISSKPKSYLWERLTEIAPKKMLLEIVRTRLKIRNSWRVER